MRKKETEQEQAQSLETVVRIGIGILISFGICVFCLCIFSFGISYGFLPETWIKSLTLAACFLGSGGGGWLTNQRCKGHHLVTGIAVGGGLFLMIMAVGKILYQGSTLDHGGVVLAVGSLCGGAISGLLSGLPKRKHRKKPLNKKRR